MKYEEVLLISFQYLPVCINADEWYIVHHRSYRFVHKSDFMNWLQHREMSMYQAIPESAFCSFRSLRCGI